MHSIESSTGSCVVRLMKVRCLELSHSLAREHGNTYHLISTPASILGALVAILFCFGTPPTHNRVGATIFCCHGARTWARAEGRTRVKGKEEGNETNIT